MHDSTMPRRYRIVVRGRLGEHLATAFGPPLELASTAGESVLTGTVADQAQLHGLLDRLRDLGIQLVSVNPAESSAGESPREETKRCSSSTA